MKKLAKVVGLVGGVVAILWAMRDRFISLATSHEPEVPTFRAVKPKEPAAGVNVIDGIGPVFAARLKDAGLSNVRDLATATADTVAEAAGVSAARARSWIEQAQATS